MNCVDLKFAPFIFVWLKFESIKIEFTKVALFKFASENTQFFISALLKLSPKVIFKIPSLTVSVSSLKDILASIQAVAESLEVPKIGHQLIDKIKKKINDYRIQLKPLKPRQVLMLLSDTNDPSRDLYAVGRGTFLNELLMIAGGENVLPQTMAKYPKISKEFIIAKSPEIIIEIGPKSNLSNEGILVRKKAWGKYPTLRAVRNDRLYFIGADYILIPGPRLVNILDDLTRNIHPELFLNQPVKKPATVSQ